MVSVGMKKDSEQIRRAIARDRGYADLFGNGFGKDAVELEVSELLLSFLVHSDIARPGRLEPNTDDPPDVVLYDQRDGLWGIEVTEIVDSSAVERGRYIKKGNTDQKASYGLWDEDRLSNEIRKILKRKDSGIWRTKNELARHLLVIHTDEMMIDIEIARKAIENLGDGPTISFFDSAFLLLSYEPRADRKVFPDGYAVLEIPLNRQNGA